MQERYCSTDKDDDDFTQFDRIKYQRKRMEHILEVIKDLTFRNKELMKQNLQLKDQIKEGQKFRSLYEEILTERTILVDKNITIHSELQRLREKALQQEMLISQLKRELYGHQYRHFDQLGSNFSDNLLMQEYKILKLQYEDLQSEYSALYQQHCTQSDNARLINLIAKQNKMRKMQKSYNKKQTAQTKYDKQNRKKSGFGQIYQTTKSNKSLALTDQTIEEQPSIQDDMRLSKLELKYERAKMSKKKLSKIAKTLEEELKQYKLKDQQQSQLIDSMKEQSTTLCQCHVNKLEKQLSQKTISMSQQGNSSKNVISLMFK